MVRVYMYTRTCTRMHYAAVHVTPVLVGIYAAIHVSRHSGISQAAAIAVNHTQGVLRFEQEK